MSDLVVARNCCMTRMLPGEAELVSERTGLPGRAKSVKRFERSNGPDIALYKNYLFYTYTNIYMSHIWVISHIAYALQVKHKAAIVVLSLPSLSLPFSISPSSPLDFCLSVFLSPFSLFLPLSLSPVLTLVIP